MRAAVEAALPADAFIGAAAVADWRVADASRGKIKKEDRADRRPCALSKTPTSWRKSQKNNCAAGLS